MNDTPNPLPSTETLTTNNMESNTQHKEVEISAYDLTSSFSKGKGSRNIYYLRYSCTQIFF